MQEGQTTKAVAVLVGLVGLVGLVASMSVGMGDAVGSEEGVRIAAQPVERATSVLAEGATERDPARRWKSEPFKASLQGGGWQWCRLSVRKPFYDNGFMKTRIRTRCRDKDIRFASAYHGLSGPDPIREYKEPDFDGNEPEWNWNDRTNYWVHKVKLKMDWEPGERYQASGKIGHGFHGEDWKALVWQNTYT